MEENPVWVFVAVMVVLMSNSNNHHVYFSLLLFVLDSGAVCKITAAVRTEKKSGKRLYGKGCSFRHDKSCNPCLTRCQNRKETRQKVKMQMLFIQTWQTMQPVPDSQSEQKRNQAKGSTAKLFIQTWQTVQRLPDLHITTLKISKLKLGAVLQSPWKLRSCYSSSTAWCLASAL